MSTKSRPASARSASEESYHRAPGMWVASAARCAGRASVPATISTSCRRRQAGTCPWMAMLPNPMIAPRSILLEPVLADGGAERLVEDREPGQCLLFADHERRVDADRGRVRHRDQAAPQALLVERLGDGLREPFLRRPVADELDAEHQPAAAHLAHAPVLLLQRLETGEHDLADALGVGDEVLFEDDLERGEPRCGGERVAAIARGAGTRVGPGLARGDRVRGDHAGERKSPAHALADGHDVRNHAVVLRAPHGTGPAESRQHLVGDQERPVLARDRLDRAKEPLGRHHVAGRALDGLDDDRADLAGGLVADDLAEELGARDPTVRIAELERAAVAVADAPDPDPGDEVDVLVAVLVDEGRARAAGHRQPGHEGKGLAPRRDVPPLLGHDALRPRTDLPPLGHGSGGRAPGRLRGWPETRRDLAPPLTSLAIPARGRAPGRLRGWPETRRDLAPSLTSLSIPARGRAPGRLRGWPETRRDLAPSLRALFISQQAGVQ